MNKTAKFLLTAVLAASMIFSGCNKNSQDNKEEFDLSKKNEFVRTEYSAKTVEDGIYNNFQIGGYYDPTRVIPADSVMAYASTISGVEALIKSYLGKGFKQVDMMIPNGRDMDCFFIHGGYDGKNHEDIVQKSRDGAWRIHTPGSYYVHPSEEFNAYLVDWCKRAIAAGAKDIYIEEPDGFKDSCYSEYFFRLWEKKYGESFVYDEDDLTQPAKRQSIIAQMFVDSYDYVSTEIKKTYPDSKVYIATHSIGSYSSIIVANNGKMVSLENIDGVIGQSWTNTSMLPLYYEGEKAVRYFETSYLEYSELNNYIVGLDGKKAFMLNDANADGGYSYDVTRPIWEHNIVAQMLMPDVYCFESTVWAERAFTNAPYEYKTVQEGIYRIQQNVHDYSSVTYGGTEGIGVLVSYTGCSAFGDMVNNLSALVTPLVSKGIPVDVITLERLTDTKVLKNIKLLVMSYDFIKPDDIVYNKSIAEWVKNGGTLLYVGGYNYAQSFDGVWKDEGYATPQDALFSELGVNVNGFEAFNGNKTLTAAKNNPSYLTGTKLYNDDRATFTAYDIGAGATALLTAENKVVAFEAKSGKGNVIVCGVEPVGMSSSENSYSELYEKLIIRSCQLGNLDYRAPEAMYTIRGDYYFCHAFEKEIALKGEYLDLFSDNFDYIVDPVVKKGQSVCYKRVQTTDTDVMHSNGNVTDFVQNPSSVTFTVSNILRSRSLTVVSTGGMPVKSVEVKFKKTGTVPEKFTYNASDDGYVTLSYILNKAEDVEVTVYFG